jgi:hypothetical protein
MNTSKIVGRKIKNLIIVQYGTVSKFCETFDIEKDYDIIRCALNGTTRLLIETAIDVLTHMYGESMAIMKLSEEFPIKANI